MKKQFNEARFIITCCSRHHQSWKESLGSSHLKHLTTIWSKEEQVTTCSIHFPVSIYTIHSSSKEIVFPTMRRSSHFDKYNKHNPPEHMSKERVIFQVVLEVHNSNHHRHAQDWGSRNSIIPGGEAHGALSRLGEILGVGVCWGKGSPQWHSHWWMSHDMVDSATPTPIKSKFNQNDNACFVLVITKQKQTKKDPKT